MPLSWAFSKGRSARVDEQSSSAPSSKPDRIYSAGLSQKAIDVLENGRQSPDIAKPPYRFRFNVPSPASRQFAPVPSPLEHLVPYTPKTRLVSPTVADHLNSNLASSPKVYGKCRRVGARSFFSKMLEHLINAIHPPLTGRDARLIPSTLEDITDYLSEQHSEPWRPEVHFGKSGGMSQEQKKAAMLVFDVFTAENRALRAFAIGPSPQSPLYVFYPLKHPYDEDLLETLANRGAGICIYPPYIPDPGGINEEDTAEAEKDKKKDEKESFWKKAIKKLCAVTKRKPSQKPISIPLQTLRSAATAPVEPQATYSLSQSFLQFRDPLEGFRPDTVSGIRWSSHWINQRLRNCLDDPPAPEPTEEELTAQARRAIRIVCYEARLAKLTGAQKLFYKLMHKRSVYKDVKSKDKAAGREPSRANLYPRHQSHKRRQDAGVMFNEPDVTTLQDVRLAEYILPALDAEKEKNKCGSGSHCSTDTGYSSARNLSAVTTTTSSGPVTPELQEKPKITLQLGARLTLQRKHPTLRQDPAFGPSHTPRPQTIHDLSTLTRHLRLTAPTPEPGGSTFHTKYVIADEYLALSQRRDPTELVVDEPGIQIFYEPPTFRTKSEKLQSGVDYISGRYLWVHKRAAWVVVYERRKPRKAEMCESMEVKEEERKQLEEAKRSWGKGDWRSKAEQLQKRLVRRPLRNFGRVKLYTPTGSGQELLGYLNLEKGQFSIRRDVTTGQLHLAVLAMFSVMNFEEAVEEERKLRKTFEGSEDPASPGPLPTHNPKHPEGNPVTAIEVLQTELRARYTEPTLPGVGEMAEHFVTVDESDTKTYFRSTGVRELIRRAMAPSAVESDSGSDSGCDTESDSGTEGIQEIVRRTSHGWRRRSNLPQDAGQRKL